MGGFAPLALTATSDLFHAVSIILMVVCLAVGGSKPTNNFSWSKFNLDYTYKGTTYTYDFYLGLHVFDECIPALSSTCIETALNDPTNFNGRSDDGQQCYNAGSGVIAAATFAMLFGLLAMVSLHTYTSFKRMCGCACPVPRLFLAIFSILSLGLYIAVVCIWWVKCHNPLSSLLYAKGDQNNTPQSPNVQVGYALMVAVICAIFSFLAFVLATVRCFLGNDDGPATTTKSGYGASSGSASPAHGNGSYAHASSPSAGGGAYNTSKEGETFGY